MFEITIASRSPTGRRSTGGVPDLAQVAELDPGIVASGLEAVVAVAGGDRLECDQEIPLSAGTGPEPPGSVPAGRAVLAGGREGEPWAVPVPVVFGFGPGAAVPDSMPVLVGDGHAPGRLGILGGGAGQLAGEGGVDEANSVHLAGLAPRCSPWRLQTTRGYPGSRHGR